MAELQTFDFHKYIQGCIAEIEQKYNVTVVLAVESGSRMWGFPSEDSDYDIRFIYTYNDVRDQFKVDAQEDNITYKDANPLIDAHGWDIQKAVALMVRGNGSVMDWISSPIVYKEDVRIKSLLAMLQHYLLSSPNIIGRLANHHRGLAKRIYKEAENAGDIGTFKAKDALYCIRSILLAHRLTKMLSFPSGVVPSVTIDELLVVDDSLSSLVTPELISNIRSLITMKRAAKKEKSLRVDLYGCFSDVHKFIMDGFNSFPAVKTGDRDVACTNAGNATLRAIMSW